MTRTVAIDFFCGAGGMTNGLIKAGIHVIAGVDNERLCEETYRQNRNADGTAPEYICKNIFPKSSFCPDGQRKEIAAQIEHLIQDHKRKTGRRRLNLIFAICAPCQPFTKITKIKMSTGRQFKRTNDRNLLLTTIKFISTFRPDAILCENVEGLVIVNASKFGIPQNRRRTIGIAVDRTKHDFELTIEEANSRVKEPPTVESVIGYLPPIAAGEVHASIRNHRARDLNSLNLKRISCAVPGESNAYLSKTPYGDLSLDCHRRLTKKAGAASFTDTYTRMRGDQLAPTITTKSMSITNGRFGHYDVKQNRGLSPREAALLQTFPRGYVFHPEDNLEFTALLIGNAVPPRLAKYFGNYLREQIEG
jgi:DNA (cytosine-5)-methyltransferase 1